MSLLPLQYMCTSTSHLHVKVTDIHTHKLHLRWPPRCVLSHALHAQAGFSRRVISWVLAMVDIRQGDIFVMRGPRQEWWQGKTWGWQPRAWTRPPGSVPRGEIVRDIHIDFSQNFVAEYVMITRKFHTAQVTIPGTRRTVWINIGKHKRSWAQKVDPPVPPPQDSWYLWEVPEVD